MAEIQNSGLRRRSRQASPSRPRGFSLLCGWPAVAGAAESVRRARQGC